MPRGDKSKYTDKQERKADHIAEGYEKKGVGKDEAERRAWATVNKDDGGGKKPGGSGRGARTGHPAAPQRWTPRRQSCRFKARGGAVCVSQQGGRDPQAARPLASPNARSIA